MAAWLTSEVPSRTVPSSGIRSPGRTMTVAPGSTSATGRSCSAPSRSTRARSGESSSSERTARRVLATLYDSSISEKE